MGRLREGRRGCEPRRSGVNRGVGRYRPATTRGGTFVLIESRVDGCASARRRAGAGTTLLVLLDFGNGLAARADGGCCSGLLPHCRDQPYCPEAQLHRLGGLPLGVVVALPGVLVLAPGVIAAGPTLPPGVAAALPGVVAALMYAGNGLAAR